MKYWEDFKIGERAELGSRTFTEQEIIAFVGLVKHRWEAVNQRGELVLTMEGWGMFGRKH